MKTYTSKERDITVTYFEDLEELNSYTSDWRSVLSFSDRWNIKLSLKPVLPNGGNSDTFFKIPGAHISVDFVTKGAIITLSDLNGYLDSNSPFSWNAEQSLVACLLHIKCQPLYHVDKPLVYWEHLNDLSSYFIQLKILYARQLNNDRIAIEALQTQLTSAFKDSNSFKSLDGDNTGLKMVADTSKFGGDDNGNDGTEKCYSKSKQQHKKKVAKSGELD